MTPRDEVLERIVNYQRAKAKRQTLSDVVDFLENHSEKLERQIREVARKCEKLQHSGKSIQAYHKTLTHLEGLRHQHIHTLELQKELLERMLDAGKMVEVAEAEFEIAAQRFKAETSQEG